MAESLTMTLQTQKIRGTATIADTLTTPVDDSAITKSDSGEFIVAGNATDQLIALAASGPSKYLHAELSGGCTVKLNSSGATGIAFTPVSGQPALLALAGCAVTALYVTNPASTPITVQLIAAA